MATTEADPLRKDFEFYLQHQDDFVAKYDGQVIALKDGVVLGAYKSYLEALEATCVEHEQGTFMLQKVSAGDKDYTATYRSRVRPS